MLLKRSVDRQTKLFTTAFRVPANARATEQFYQPRTTAGTGTLL